MSKKTESVHEVTDSTDAVLAAGSTDPAEASTDGSDIGSEPPRSKPQSSLAEDTGSASGVADSESGAPNSSVKPRVMVDPRGQRFSAAISVVVLAVALLAGVKSDLSVVLITVQGLAFGMGAFFGLRFQPYGWLFRVLVRPRIGAPANYEDEPPPRFAQLVGFVFVLVALAAITFDLVGLAYVAVGLALAAAFLNAAFGFCLGCQVYLMFKRTVSK